MFVFAIETCGRTVAFTKETDRLMLEGMLTGDRDEGKHLLDGLSLNQLWDGKAPITARLATHSEELDYGIEAHEAGFTDVNDDESLVMFSLQNAKGENVLLIPPALRRAA
jgi:hypothetical protein